MFVATLPYSGYSYVEAFFSMNQDSWTTAHVNAYKYFGGVTRIIQCDNLKTGVQKHGKDEVVLNKSYQELAEHYGTAILPARVRAPKDKAAVEGTVGIISTFILAALRNRQFLSLLELNEAIWDRLEAFNHKPFQKREGSRASSFAEERPFLRPLPPRPFELAIWKVATVGPNYHISVERMGLLKLADKYTPERLENACKRALEYTPRPSLKNIQAILASGQDKAIPEQSTATASSSQYGFTRGADYYGRGNK